ncbi:FAS1 domain-containing protein [Pterulicium gracile]|uniref:FAS1 domain-containing protein n=1 Tax=Pterulicium gracile TaxID=1884261 RepID=A0A5C3R490_9AGAR|nr:FAS1 domain-containing protein [Pterula gracilis]
MHALQYFSLLAAASAVLAQEDALAGLVTALESLGLNGLAGAAAAVNGTDQGLAILQALTSGGNYTIFAPSNEAFAAVPESVSSNQTLLASILSYHVLPGNYANISSDFPNVTVARTLLNQTSGLVDLEGDRNQVLVWATIDGQGTLLNQGDGTNVTVTNSTTFNTLLINEINGVLLPPPALDAVLADPTLNLTGLAGVVEQLAGENDVQNNPFASGEELKGFTLFAPNTEAFEAAQSVVATLNASQIANVLRNHLLNGTTVYSPQVAIENAPQVITSGGQTMSFTSNTTGTFVTVGAGSDANSTATARIVRSDVLVENGVVHIIDGVLAVAENDEQAADEAAESAASVAEGYSTMATETAPVGQPTNGAANGGGDGNGEDAGGAAATFLPSVALVTVGAAFGFALVLA